MVLFNVVFLNQTKTNYFIASSNSTNILRRDASTTS